MSEEVLNMLIKLARQELAQELLSRLNIEY
jgi:hypothetical protein